MTETSLAPYALLSRLVPVKQLDGWWLHDPETNSLLATMNLNCPMPTEDDMTVALADMKRRPGHYGFATQEKLP